MKVFEGFNDKTEIQIASVMETMCLPISEIWWFEQCQMLTVRGGDEGDCPETLCMSEKTGKSLSIDTPTRADCLAARPLTT